MTKKIILGDIHFGVRNDSPLFHNNMEKFFDKVLFPYIELNQIRHVICVGDVFDNRKKIDMLTAKRSRHYFFETLARRGVTMDIIAGNHDLFYRENSDVTALREILNQYDNIVFYTRPQMVGKYAYIPWINKQNREETLKFIASVPQGTIGFAHLELVGFQWYRGVVATHGDDPEQFNRFKRIYTGHYHHRSTQGNISYVGSLTQHTWADHGDVRGFHVIDDVTDEVTFVENPYSMFEILQYAGNLAVPQHDVDGKFVRIQVVGDVKQTQVDNFVRNCVSAGAVQVQVISPKSEILAEQRVDEEVNVEDTPSLIRSVVEDDSVFSKLIELYNTAISLK